MCRKGRRIENYKNMGEKLLNRISGYGTSRSDSPTFWSLRCVFMPEKAEERLDRTLGVINMAEMFDNTIKKTVCCWRQWRFMAWSFLFDDELRNSNRVTQKRPSFDSGTCKAPGRLEEMAEICI